MNNMFVTNDYLNENIKLINISPICDLEKPCSHVCECQLATSEHIMLQLPMTVITNRVDEINPDMLEHFARYSDNIKKIISDKDEYKKRSYGFKWRTHAGEVILEINPVCSYKCDWCFPCCHECLCKYPNGEQKNTFLDCHTLSNLLRTNKLSTIKMSADLHDHILNCSDLRNYTFPTILRV